MPYLKFEFSKEIEKNKVTDLLEFTKHKFSEIMCTGKDHIAISVSQLRSYSLLLGRAKKDEQICLMNFDIRSGRTQAQKREIVSVLMDYINKNIGIKTSNQYLTYTEHPGEDFNLTEKCLGNWKEGDDPLNE